MPGDQGLIQNIIQRFHGTGSAGQQGTGSFGAAGNPNTVYNQPGAPAVSSSAGGGMRGAGWLQDFLGRFLGRRPPRTNPPVEGGGGNTGGPGAQPNPGAPPPPPPGNNSVFDRLGDLSDWQQWLDLFVPGDMWDSRNNQWNITGIAQAVANSLGIPVTDNMMNNLVTDLTDEQIAKLPRWLQKIVRAVKKQVDRQQGTQPDGGGGNAGSGGGGFNGGGTSIVGTGGTYAHRGNPSVTVGGVIIPTNVANTGDENEPNTN